MTASDDRTPAVTVVICTMTSRLVYLGRCLESLVAARGNETAEVLLVAMAGEDMSGPLARFGAQLDLGVRFAATRGLSDKRNVGAAAARSEIVAYLDDDAVVRADYFEAIRAVFAGGARYVAGAVEPSFEGPVPPGLEPALFSFGGFNRFGGRELRDRYIGANCLFRRDALLALGDFDTRLGPGSTWLPWGDDSEMFRRAADAGGVQFAPDVTVIHAIQAERLTKAYLLTRAYRVGRTGCALDRLHQPRFWRRALWTPAYLVRSALTPAWFSGRIEARVKVRQFAGYLTQLVLLLLRGMPRRV